MPGAGSDEVRTGTWVADRRPDQRAPGRDGRRRVGPETGCTPGVHDLLSPVLRALWGIAGVLQHRQGPGRGGRLHPRASRRPPLRPGQLGLAAGQRAHRLGHAHRAHGRRVVSQPQGGGEMTDRISWDDVCKVYPDIPLEELQAQLRGYGYKDTEYSLDSLMFEVITEGCWVDW